MKPIKTDGEAQSWTAENESNVQHSWL